MPINKSKKKKKIQNKEIDYLKYKIKKENVVEEDFDFSIDFFKLYFGDLEDCIAHFIDHYGPINGKIHYDKVRHLIGFTGSQVVPKIEVVKIEDHNT